MKGAEAMRKFQPDWIVAMGGGSPIDAAKAMWAFYEYPDCTFEQLITPFSFPELRQKAHFCAIPSTSGTATEVTAFSVITDYDKGIKYPLADFNITPDVAIVDPDLAEKMPPKLTAHTGMDAMTHAIEAYVSTLHCNYTDPLALHAIKMIHNDLKKSYDGDMDARDRMHDAQCLAGMAFSNALLGIVHSMAHKTGAAFSGGHIIHGAANAMYLDVYKRQIPAVQSLLESVLSQSALLASAAASQFISNVPAAVLLSGFTQDGTGLLLGTDLGGLGTPIASLASLISLKAFLKAQPQKAASYVLLFLVTNVIGLVILLAFARLLGAW